MRVFLMGVDDPEMRAIARLLREAGEKAIPATKDGRPVLPAVAYAADPVDLAPGETELVCVECRPAVLPAGAAIVVVDHHRPGDPGYGMPPERFWEASSLGQTHALLGLVPGPGAATLAAMDHCFAAALRGECPGVAPDDVLDLKYGSIAHAFGCDRWAAETAVGAYRVLVASAPRVHVGPQTVADLRDVDVGDGYSLAFLALQLAVVVEGDAALLRHRESPGAPEKVLLTGNAAPRTVEIFTAGWGGYHGLADLYGVPGRGYAGGYVDADGGSDGPKRP